MALKFNPFTGNFDWDNKSDSTDVAKIACEKAVEVVRSIVTTDRNVLGNLNFFYDAATCKWVEAPPQLVTDEDGRIIVDTSQLEDC